MTEFSRSRSDQPCLHRITPALIAQTSSQLTRTRVLKLATTIVQVSSSSSSSSSSSVVIYP